MMVRRYAALACLSAAVACGFAEPGEGPGEVSRAPAETLSLVADGRDDAVVAMVAGRPVHASCVMAQARARGQDARDALDACIGFELLAQAAQARGHDRDPEVLDLRRRQAARTLIREEFAASFAGPEDVPRADLEEIWPRARRRFDHPELRFTVYVRAPVPDDAAPGSAADREARALAGEIHAALADHTNLDESRFLALAREVAGERRIQRGEPLSFPRAGRVHEDFAEAAFAIPEAGMVSSPTRMPGGWDVILLTRVERETRKDFDEALPELRELVFDASRRRAFLAWAERYQAAADITLHEEHLERLAELGELFGVDP
jgi:hypothetical protein